eukprot:scaffold6484_cov114-Skeletonema_dohrnii-CCMP3373.AAC.1
MKHPYLPPGTGQHGRREKPEVLLASSLMSLSSPLSPGGSPVVGVECGVEQKTERATYLHRSVSFLHVPCAKLEVLAS